MRSRHGTWALLAALLAAHSGAAAAAEQGPRPSLAAVAYGPEGRQTLDVWKSGGTGPVAAVIYFHGGSWARGASGSVASIGHLAEYLAAGLAVVSVNYRFVQDAEKGGVSPPVRWPMMDCARAVQFVRHQAPEWGIDPKRIGFSGGSAGACTALWLAMHDDLALPMSPDPVERESTRPLCAGVLVAQTTLDPRQVREWFKAVPAYGAHAFGFHLEGGSQEALFDRLEAARERILPWIREYSPIEHASADDPPIYLQYDHKPPGDTIHGAMYGIKLKEKLDSLGVDCTLSYPGAKAPADADEAAFLIHRLTTSAAAHPSSR